MTTALSSTALAAELAALITSMSSGAQLLFRDTNGNAIATAPLGNPPGVIVGLNAIVLLGLPEYATVSSQAAVGAQVGTVDILNESGVPIMTGINTFVPVNQVAIASSSANPGGQLGVIGGAISLP